MPSDPQSPIGDDLASSEPGGKVARNFAFSLISMLVATPLNVVGMLILARKLGPETAGLCFTVFAVAVVVFITSGLGVSTLLTRNIAANPRRYREITGQGAALLLVVILLVRKPVRMVMNIHTTTEM